MVKLMLAAFAAVSVAACATDDRQAEIVVSMELASNYYGKSKFDQAKDRYMAVLEMDPEHYEAMVGLGNSCREYGNQLYGGVDELVNQRKVEQAQKMLKEANENHVLAYQCFKKSIEIRPNDDQPRYGLALFYYQRATSPIPYPHRMDDTENRREERDLAIEEFTQVVERVPELYQARRYLGLALFAAARMEEGKTHLKAYLDAVQTLYDHVFATWPNRTEEEQRRKSISLDQLEKDIADVREVIVLYRDGLMKKRRELEAKGALATTEERQELARASREMLEIDQMIRGFSIIQLGPDERSLKERCIEYLGYINRGALTECLSFLTFPTGDPAAGRRKLSERLENGVRYDRIRFSEITVTGEDGVVSLSCSYRDRESEPVQTDLTLRWRRVGGQWLVVEHP